MGNPRYRQFYRDAEVYGPQPRNDHFRGDGYDGSVNQVYSRNDQRQRPRKKSGAKYGYDKKGNPFVRGWKATRFGLITYLAVPTSKTGSHEGKTQTWQNWMVKVNPPAGMGNEYTTSGLFSEQTHKVIVATEGIVMNPNAPNGGYCGRFGGKR